MKNWAQFLKTLATEGGSIFILIVMSCLFLFVWIFYQQDYVKEAFMLVLGALLGILKGNFDHRTHREEIPVVRDPEQLNE